MVNSNLPYYVFGVIEFFGKFCNKELVMKINVILKLNEIPVELYHGKVVSRIDSHIDNRLLNSVQETGLKEFLQEANKYYREEDYQIAVEKLWDAFERLKTY